MTEKKIASLMRQCQYAPISVNHTSTSWKLVENVSRDNVVERENTFSNQAKYEISKLEIRTWYNSTLFSNDNWTERDLASLRITWLDWHNGVENSLKARHMHKERFWPAFHLDHIHYSENYKKQNRKAHERSSMKHTRWPRYDRMYG